MFNYHKDIKKFLMEASGYPVGDEARRIEVLSCFINGILESGTSDLHEISRHMPIKTTFSNQVKQFNGWLEQGLNSWYMRYLPCLELFLSGICATQKDIKIAIDGTDLGDGCTGLMISLVWKSRGIPLCWVVRKGKKGHLPQRMHLELLTQIKLHVSIHPAIKGKKITLLGDGEFDGGELTKACQEWGWSFVLRTAHNILIHDQEEEFHFNELQEIAYQRGANKGHYWLFLEHILYTKERFGYVNALFWHAKKYKDPLFLLTNLDAAFDAYQDYKCRFSIETLFGDLKSRGFNIHKSHLDDPNKLMRLLIAVCLAFLISCSLAMAHNADKLKKLVTPEHKNDLSIFKFGYCIFKRCLRNQYNIVFKLSMNFVILLI